MEPETPTLARLFVLLRGLNRAEDAPIFSPMRDGGIEKQTDSICTGKAERARRGERERERETEAVKGREEEGVTYL